jgi:hypothetical protein
MLPGRGYGVSAICESQHLTGHSIQWNGALRCFGSMNEILQAEAAPTLRESVRPSPYAKVIRTSESVIHVLG